MAKERKGDRVAGPAAKASEQTEALGAETGRTSEQRGVWLDAEGRLCVGSECFTVMADAKRGEVRVEIDRDECGDVVNEVIDDMVMLIGRGAPTVYVTKSKKLSG